MKCSKCGKHLLEDDEVLQVRKGYMISPEEFEPEEDLELKHAKCP